MTNQEIFEQSVLENDMTNFLLKIDNNDVDTSYKNNFAICLSSLEGYNDILMVLLEKNYNIQFKNLLSALTNADYANNIRGYQFLLKNQNIKVSFSKDADDLYKKLSIEKNNIKLSKKEQLILFLSAQRERNDVIEKYLEYNNPDPEFLILAVRTHNYHLINLLLKYENYDLFDIDYVFHLSIKYNNLEVFNLLIQKKEIRKNITHADLLVAVENGSSYIVKYILKHTKIDPSENSNSALSLAVQYNHIDIVKLLLENKKVSICEGLLGYSIEFKYEEITYILLKEKNIDVSELEHQAIKLAVFYYNSKLINELFQHKSVRLYLKQKESALFNEIYKNKLENF